MRARAPGHLIDFRSRPGVFAPGLGEVPGDFEAAMLLRPYRGFEAGLLRIARVDPKAPEASATVSEDCVAYGHDLESHC